jgi:hypothetical protein
MTTTAGYCPVATTVLDCRYVWNFSHQFLVLTFSLFSQLITLHSFIKIQKVERSKDKGPNHEIARFSLITPFTAVHEK